MIQDKSIENLWNASIRRDVENKNIISTALRNALILFMILSRFLMYENSRE